MTPHGVGPERAGQLLVTAGDNTHRLTSEGAFAKLCDVAPQPANSGRHRLSRGGDRDANSALYMIVITRMRDHDPTRAYLTRRTTEGLTKREIIPHARSSAAANASSSREAFDALRTTA